MAVNQKGTYNKVFLSTGYKRTIKFFLKSSKTKYCTTLQNVYSTDLHTLHRFTHFAHFLVEYCFGTAPQYTSTDCRLSPVAVPHFHIDDLWNSFKQTSNAIETFQILDPPFLVCSKRDMHMTSWCMLRSSTILTRIN